MKITQLQLKNFKRFSDLTIQHIPESAKLVLLIGANGSGKSSIFDAFEYADTMSRHNEQKEIDYVEYYNKDKNSSLYITINDPTSQFGYFNKNEISIGSNFNLNSFYGRTSLRQTPSLTRKGTGQGKNVSNNEDRPNRFIDFDERFENDIEDIGKQILELIFRGEKIDSFGIRDQFIEPINQALKRIFTTDNYTIDLLEIIPPLQEDYGIITFKKGKSKIHYNLLSNGEKAVFNILLNLFVRGKYFNDTIYFIDELDLHLNTQLQYNFLKEITENWIPENCQLWTASHSLGFIEYAKQSEQAVIIDFDNYDFDLPKVLYPQIKDNLEIYEIAVPKDFLLEMLKGKKIVVCENNNDKYYNTLRIENTVFVGVRDARDVFLHIKREPNYHSLRDRDFLSDTEIVKIQTKYPNHHILKYYDFENYLYHPDNIEELNLPNFNKEAYIQEIINQKKAKLNYILPTLVSSRNSYEEFKTDEKLKDKNTDFIVDDFSSDEFERFYKFFDMKVQFDKLILESFNPNPSLLVQTQWFKSKIEEILNNQISN